MPSKKVTFAGPASKQADHKMSDPLAGIDEAVVAKGSDLLRTILAFPPPAEGGSDVPPEAALCDAPAGLWKYPEPKGEEDSPEVAAAAAKAAAKGAAKPPPKTASKSSTEAPVGGALEAKPDTEGGALLLSHAWDAPSNWSKYFVAQSFAEAKSLQVSTALERARERGDSRTGAHPRIWVDCASLPDPVDPKDHPCEQVVYGPFRMPVRELKRLFPPASRERQDTYTVLRIPDGDKWEGTMQTRNFDEQGRPGKNTTAEEVAWEILPGWYHVLSAKVLPEDRVSPDMAAAIEEFRPRGEQLRSWCTANKLRDEIWVEITLGTLRAECFFAVQAMLGLHAGMVAVVAWNYFDRLWPLCEWAVFCLRHGADRAQLAADAFSAARVELHRAIRRISVEGAACRDLRDRPLLLELLEIEFSFQARDDRTGFDKPAATLGLLPVVERVVDFSPVERFVRATAIGIFGREAAFTASRQRHCDDEAGWCELANTLGFEELYHALKKCKPYDWYEAAKRSAAEPSASAETDEEAAALDRIKVEEASYRNSAEEWWRHTLLPVLEAERLRAARGGR